MSDTKYPKYIALCLILGRDSVLEEVVEVEDDEVDEAFMFGNMS